MARVGDRRRGRPPDGGGEALADVRGQHRIGIGPQHQRRAAILAQGLLHALTCGRPGGVRGARDQQREGSRAGLGGHAGVGRVVGGDHLLAGVVLARPAHEEADGKVLGALDEVAKRLPRLGHVLVTREQPRVEDH